MESIKDIKKELAETKKYYGDLIDVNVRLKDEATWAIEDKERALRRIERALEILQKEEFDKQEVIQVLTEDYVEEE